MPEINCKELETCPRVRAMLDRDMPEAQYAEAIRDTCARCDKREPEKKEE